MTVISSLFSGISGIVSNGSALSVAGDNIANMSTPAFKSSIPVFENALSQRIGEAEIGLGSRLAATTANFSQGAFANSTRPTDLAIDGRGFFVVENESGDRYFTRAGMFEKDSNGRLVTSAGGLALQGYAIDDTGNRSGTLSEINMSTVNSAAVETRNIDISINLDSDETILAGAFDGSTFEAAKNSSNYSMSVTLYDSLGNEREVQVYFRKTAANSWNWYALTDGSNLSDYSGAADGTVVIRGGQLTFNTDGELQAQTNLYPVPGVTENAAGTAINAGEQINDADDINWVGATPVPVFDAGNVDMLHFEFGLNDPAVITTQFNQNQTSVTNISQDGRAAGTLNSFDIDEDGTIVGNFSNGTSRSIFQIALANFRNEEGMTRVGNNLYLDNTNSGLPQFGVATQGGLGSIRAFTVEQSNVDLATEFVRIITFQRAFQASSRTVSTAAEMLQDLVNLGR